MKYYEKVFFLSNNFALVSLLLPLFKPKQNSSEIPVSFTFKLFLFFFLCIFWKVGKSVWKVSKQNNKNKVSNLYFEKNFVTSAHLFLLKFKYQKYPFRFQFHLKRGRLKVLALVDIESCMRLKAHNHLKSSIMIYLWHLKNGEDLNISKSERKNYFKFNKVIWFRLCWFRFLEKLRIWLNVKWLKLACHVGFSFIYFDGGESMVVVD